MSSTFNPVVYLPSNLDLDNLLSMYPPLEITAFSLDKLKYIIGLINSIPSNNKSLFTPDGFIPINAARLQNSIKDYRKYFAYLIRTNVIESDNFYIPGTKSYSFRFTPAYNTIMVPGNIGKYTLRKQIQQNSDPGLRRKTSDLAFLAKWFNPALQIDKRDAYAYLAEQYRKNRLKLGEYEARRKYSHHRMSVDRIANSDFHFMRDDNVGRLHTNLTNIISGARNFITYDKMPLVSVDIRNSQPFLSNTLMNTTFYNFSRKRQKSISGNSNSDSQYYDSVNLTLQEISKNYNFTNINSSIKIFNILSYLMIGKNEVSIAAVEFQRFRDLTSKGLLYEYIETEVNSRTGKVFPNRKALKEVIFLVMFTDNHFIGQPEAEPKRIFRDLFPNIYKLFSLIKKGDPSILPRLLQSIEAKIILDRVSYRISIDYPYLPIFSIHDSLTCPVGHEDYVASVIREEIIKAIGTSPTLKYEYWSAASIHA